MAILYLLVQAVYLSDRRYLGTSYILPGVPNAANGMRNVMYSVRLSG